MWQEISKFEVRYRLRRPETYAYALAIFLFSLFAVDLVFEGRLQELTTTAPFVISFAMAAATALLLLVVSLVMGTSVLRDARYDIESLLFVNPITKRDFFLGRFLGSFLVLLLLFTAMPLGFMLGEYLPWRNGGAPAEVARYLLPFCFFVLPTLFFSGALFFVSGALSRNIIIVYTQGIIVFIVYHLGISLTLDGAHPQLATLLDPFAFRAISIVTKSWGISERNHLDLPLGGDLLLNRSIWGLLGVLVLYFGLRQFQLRTEKIRRGRRRKASFLSAGKTRHPRWRLVTEVLHLSLDVIPGGELYQLLHGAFFYCRRIYRQRPFWGLLICSLLIIFINGIGLETTHGVSSLPLTYLIVEEFQEMSVPFFLLLLLLYSGQLLWRERELKLQLITEATPVNDFIPPLSKLLGLFLAYVPLFLVMILAGVLFQTVRGFYDYVLPVYFAGFFLDVFSFLLLYTVVAFCCQLFLHHKYLAQLLVVALFLGFQAMMVLGWDHGLYRFEGNSLGVYSEMSGYGPFVRPFLWFKLYWFFFVSLLFVLAVLFSARGTDTGWKNRYRLFRARLRPAVRRFFGVLLLLLLTLGAYLFHQTTVITRYFSRAEQSTYRADYERTLKAFEYLPQPIIIDVDLKVELYPERRSYLIDGRYQLHNPHPDTLTTIHLQQRLMDAIELEELSFSRTATLDDRFLEFGYSIYELAAPLYPGDTLSLAFRQRYSPKGISQNPDTDLLENGSNFSSDHLPGIGYNQQYELSDSDERASYQLPLSGGKADKDHPHETRRAISSGDGDQINFSAIVGTQKGQTALTSGALIDYWNTEERSYFHYRSSAPILNFYAFTSARYALYQRTWSVVQRPADTVSLEIYHHPGHDENLERMMVAMQATLSYCTKAFAPYPNDHLRIVEVPRYADYAQSLPGVINCSESMGFTFDIDDSTDVDMAFFVIAHEVAHQWWGMQAVAANVKGRHLILESLAQYTALQVFRSHYPETKAQDFLRYARRRYEEGRAKAIRPEVAPDMVDDEEYIYYYRALLQFEQLREEIGEGQLNRAFRQFFQDWKLDTSLDCQGRYATSADLLRYLREVCPPETIPLVDSLFTQGGGASAPTL